MPGNATSVELSFYLWVVTKDKSKSADDTLKVQIRNSSGTVLATLATYSNLNKASCYSQKSFSVLSFMRCTSLNFM